MEVGKRIRKLRLQQKLTLQDIADTCGFTRSLLSKIENGKIAPSLGTLSKIAEALGVKSASLIEEGTYKSAIFTPKHAIEDSNMFRTDTAYAIFTFAAEHIQKKMQPFLIAAKKGEVQMHNVSHTGEEFIYVLSGDIKFRVGSLTYLLSDGDSLYFDACEQHEVMPLSEEVRYLNIFTE